MVLEIIDRTTETHIYADVLKMHMYHVGAFALACLDTQERFRKYFVGVNL